MNRLAKAVYRVSMAIVALIRGRGNLRHPGNKNYAEVLTEIRLNQFELHRRLDMLGDLIRSVLTNQMRAKQRAKRKRSR